MQGCSGEQPAETTGTATAPKANGRFLIMSDVHFNPFANPAIVPQLAATDYTQWPALLDSPAMGYGAYGQDTYYELFKSGLQAMKRQNATPDFIVINGDFLCHNFESNFAQYSGIQNSDSLDAFVNKTVSFIFMMLEDYFPGVPVLPVLGNNDNDCNDYQVQPSGKFLAAFAKQSLPMLHGMQQTDFMATFSKGGYYMAAMPWDSSQVFIGLNTIFFSPKYKNQCNPTDTTDAPMEEFVWLKQTLAGCAAKGKKVWLSYHIPPGMDIYSSISHGLPCDQGATGMWLTNYNDSFIALVNRYSHIIMANFGGHTHMDEFRLISDGDKLTSFVHITPAISPVFSNNPGFQEITWDAQQMTLINSVTYRFKGIQVADSNVWTEEYNYAKKYQINAMNATTLGNVWNRIGSDSVTRSEYFKYYYVDNPAQIPSPWRAYWCGARYMMAQGFVDCNCGK